MGRGTRIQTTPTRLRRGLIPLRSTRFPPLAARCRRETARAHNPYHIEAGYPDSTTSIDWLHNRALRINLA